MQAKTSQNDNTTLMENEADMTASADVAARGANIQQITAMLKQNNHG